MMASRRSDISRLLVAALAAMLALAHPAAGEAASPAAGKVATDHAVSELVAAAEGVAPDGTVDVVFRQELSPGWHVYWRNPGDSGLPPEFGWELPDGFSISAVAYPAPERIEVGPFVNYGHHDEAVYVATLTAPATIGPGESVRLGLKAAWLICEEMCVPEDAYFEIEIPVVSDPKPVAAVAAHAAAVRAAQPSPWPGTAFVQLDASGPAVSLVAPEAGEIGADFHFFADAEGYVEPSAEQIAETADGAAVLRLVGGPAFDAASREPASGTLAVGSGEARRDFLITAAFREGAPAPRAHAAGQPDQRDPGATPGRDATFDPGPGGLVGLLFFGFLGGVILNAMPCVFPIVFVKAAALVRSAGHDAGVARRHGAMYAAGVVATFLALGGLLVALRAGGSELGWGFHLQSPPIVAASVAILLLVGLNLAGVFEIGGSLQGVGADLAARQGDVGSFFTGALAVFVAAPCVGPFLSAPIGAASFLPPVASLAIFASIGLGLAAPYVAVSFSPAIARALPRPGAWMTVLRQALAFPVFAGAAYFFWVLTQQVDAEGLALALAALVGIAAAAWLFGLAQNGAGGRVRIAAAALAVLAAAPLTQLSQGVAPGAAKGGYGALVPVAFDPAGIDAARGEGGVFVDFTAAWCVVCQFNKRTVLSRDDVGAMFAANGVTLMAADWTRRDPVVTRALAEFGANGVPLYVYYPPRGEPVVLPSPLRAEDIAAAVRAGVEGASGLSREASAAFRQE